MKKMLASLCRIVQIKSSGESFTSMLYCGSILTSESYFLARFFNSGRLRRPRPVIACEPFSKTFEARKEDSLCDVGLIQFVPNFRF